MPASPLNSSQIRIAGTGAIWKAPLGTVLPTDSVSAWNASFVNLGYATDGFTLKQDKKTQGVTAWQTLAQVRLITSELLRTFSFELLQTNKDTLALAWGGATIAAVAGAAVGGAITIGTNGALTTATAHGLVVGTAVQLGTVVTATGITALTTYFVISVPTTTTLVISATSGGAALTNTSGTGTLLTTVGGYNLDITAADNPPNFILGIDWSDGSTSQRIILGAAALSTLPTIKSMRTDAIRYAFDVQALAPADGSDSVVVYGLDSAVGY